MESGHGFIVIDVILVDFGKTCLEGLQRAR